VRLGDERFFLNSDPLDSAFYSAVVAGFWWGTAQGDIKRLLNFKELQKNYCRCPEHILSFVVGMNRIKTFNLMRTMTTTKTTPIQAVQPYLNFDGRAEEAIEFYRDALGAEVTVLMRFKESPDSVACSSSNGDKVMHASLRIGDTTVMASDGRSLGKAEFKGISLSITASSDADAERLFGALAEGGQVQMPLAKTFFTSRFGMVADRFGVSWMVVVAPAARP
jgi:PhnB protein